MCSASSRGSSMWPNITVEVERRPGPVRGLDDLDPAAGRQLVRRDPVADAVLEDLGRGARRRAEAALAQVVEDVVGIAPGALAHEVDLHRRVGVEVDLRRHLLRPPQPAAVVLERVVGVDAALHADLGRAELDRLADPLGELVGVDLVGVGRAAGLPEAAEGAADRADVGEVDVAVDDEGRDVAGELGAQLVGGGADLLDRLRPRLGEQRRQLVPGLSSRRLAPALDRAADRVGGAERRAAAVAVRRRRKRARRGMKVGNRSASTSRTPRIDPLRGSCTAGRRRAARSARSRAGRSRLRT